MSCPQWDSCMPPVNAQTSAIDALVQGSQYTKAKLFSKLMLWIICCHCPYAITKDGPLLKIFRMLNNRVEVPFAWTVSRNIQEVFLLTKKNVLDMLKVHSSVASHFTARWLHIGLNVWTAPNINSFLGVVVYLMRDTKMLSFVLDFVK